MNVAEFSVFDDIPAFTGVFASIISTAIDDIPAIAGIPVVAGIHDMLLLASSLAFWLVLAPLIL